jgi:hypothetical protein
LGALVWAENQTNGGGGKAGRNKASHAGPPCKNQRNKNAETRVAFTPTLVRSRTPCVICFGADSPVFAILTPAYTALAPGFPPPKRRLLAQDDAPTRVYTAILSESGGEAS